MTDFGVSQQDDVAGLTDRQLEVGAEVELDHVTSCKSQAELDDVSYTVFVFRRY